MICKNRLTNIYINRQTQEAKTYAKEVIKQTFSKPQKGLQVAGHCCHGSIKGKHGNRFTKTEEQIKRWVKHFFFILNKPSLKQYRQDRRT